MAVEMALLTLFAVGLRYARPDSAFDIYRLIGIIGFAMGLQNATITNVSGAVVRTTHVTGVITDLGLEGTQFLIWCRDRVRGRRWARDRPGDEGICTSMHPTFSMRRVIAGEHHGIVFARRADRHFLLRPMRPRRHDPFLSPFLAWIIWTDYRTPIADVREIDLLGDSEIEAIRHYEVGLRKHRRGWGSGVSPVAGRGRTMASPARFCTLD